MTKTTPTELFNGRVEIPTLPMMYIHLSDSINDPCCSIKKVEDIISSDSSLTARLLKLVNSAFYSFPSKIDTIDRAVVIVGTRQLRDLALATTVTTLFRDVPADLVNMESFWRHSICCGLAARIIASQCRVPNPERHFTAGILHDIGRLIMFKAASDKSRQSLIRSEVKCERLSESETVVFGYDHCSVGKELIRKWKLSASLEEAVGYHHSPEKALRFPCEAAVVHVADIVTHAMDIGCSGEPRVPPLNIVAWERTGATIGDLALIFEQVERQFNDVTNFLLDD